MKSNKQILQQKANNLANKIAGLSPWMEGTVVSTERVCGKKNCICHTGGQKHAVMYVTWKEAGKTISLYVPKAMEAEVRKWADNYKKLKELLREVSVIQRQMVRLRDD